jgi:acetyl esterase/lipase
MTVYAPQGKNTGVAVVVFPGGGYQILAIDLEGTEVCDWLTQKGITCVLLKYRVTDVGPYPKSGPYPESPMALEDAQRAVRLVRFHAAEWHIDPHKIGVLGFSAGGHLSVAMSVYFGERLYPAVDAADQVSCRPFIRDICRGLRRSTMLGWARRSTYFLSRIRSPSPTRISG